MFTYGKSLVTLVIVVVVMLVVGVTAIVTLQPRETYPWQVPFVSQTNVYQIFSNTPPQVKIVPTKYPQGVNRGNCGESRQGRDYYEVKFLGIAVVPELLILEAYQANPRWIAYRTQLPKKKYDYIVNVPHDSLPAFRNELRNVLGLVARYDLVETNVLLLKLAKPTADGFTEAFRPPNSLKRSMGITNSMVGCTNVLTRSDDGLRWTNTVSWFGQPMETLVVNVLENYYQQPILNRTGLTNTYDFIVSIPQNSSRQAWKEWLLNQYGVELVPTNMPVKMLVVENAK